MSSFSKTSSKNSIFFFIAILAGGISGIIYALKNAADTFALFSVRAAYEIIRDGSFIPSKRIYSYALTEYHLGLELIIANLLIITGLAPPDIVYIPIGSVLYSFGASMIISHLIANTKVNRKLQSISAIALMLVVFSGGGYVQVFYSIFHQSWAFYLLFLYLYMVINERLRGFNKVLTMTLLFIASGFIYYTVNNWLLVYTIAVSIFIRVISRLSTDFLTDSNSRHLNTVLHSKSFIFTLIILWWFINNITSQKLLPTILKDPSMLINVLYTMLFKEKAKSSYPPVATVPCFVKELERISALLIFIPILFHVLLRTRTLLKKDNPRIIRTINIDLMVLFLFVVVLMDLIGYGTLGGFFTFTRHIWITFPLVSLAIMLSLTSTSPNNRQRKSSFLLLLWLFFLITLSILRYPFKLEIVTDYNIKIQMNFLKNIECLSLDTLISDYKTNALLTFSLKDLSVCKLDTFLNAFVQDKQTYNMQKILPKGLIIASSKAMNEYVWVQQWTVLPPLKTFSNQFNEDLSLVLNSQPFIIWLKF